MATTKRERLKEARELLDIAKEQLDDAQTAWWEPTEPADCVTNAFYAYENAVTAAVKAFGLKATKKHFEKAALAKRLFKENKLKTDVSEILPHLNEVRKDVQYGEAVGELATIDLEDLVVDLEKFIDEVDAIIRGLEEA